jgi:hypothetical protein
MTAMTANTYREGKMTSEERMVIFASSLGTVFEWYDFYIYGTLEPILAAQFFSGVNPKVAFIFTLLAFAAGFSEVCIIATNVAPHELSLRCHRRAALT